MPDGWITADQVFDGRALLMQHAVLVVSDRIVDIAPIADVPADARQFKGTISPGFVDLQVNGGGGVMLNTSPDIEGIASIARAHRQFGTVAVMPTVITDTADILQNAADAAIAAKDMAEIIGLHIEGPHISLAKRGTHAPDMIRPMDAQTISIIARLRKAGVNVMITVAPEATTPDQIATLADLGAVVSLGHTDCQAADIHASLLAGARCGTHLFNAMSGMQGRAPGAVGALINADCYAGIICDGHHVTDDMVALAIRARPVPDRTFLVSDAMATVGGPKSFTLYGRTITLDGGRLINDEGNLAGAHVTQADGVGRLVKNCGVPVDMALRMATSIPAACIGVPDIGQLKGRDIADVILLDKSLGFVGTLKIENTRLK